MTTITLLLLTLLLILHITLHISFILYTFFHYTNSLLVKITLRYQYDYNIINIIHYN